MMILLFCIILFYFYFLYINTLTLKTFDAVTQFPPVLPMYCPIAHDFTKKDMIQLFIC